MTGCLFIRGRMTGMDAPLYHTDCREFTGYRPCRYRRPCRGCPQYRPRGLELLFINLDGLGDVVRNTALLPAIRRRHPDAFVTWLTRPAARPLLEHIPLVDQVVTFEPEGLEGLRARHFDLILNADKSSCAAGLTMTLQALERRGFGLDRRGVIIPLNEGARTLYTLGLEDDLKFFRNTRTHPELLAEALELPFDGEPSQLTLSEAERAEAATLHQATVGRRGVLVGINTGCNPAWPYKRLPVAGQVALIRSILADYGELGVRVALLGGRGEAALNREIAAAVDSPRLLETPTDRGVRAGAVWIGACDVVVTGDTLALHLAIALERYVVAWYGLTCHQEIDLRGRGIAILAPVGCRPCWQQTCSIEPKCHESVAPRVLREAVGELIEAVRRGERWRGESPRWEVPVGGFWESPAESSSPVSNYAV